MAILQSEKYQAMVVPVTQNRLNSEAVKLLLEDLLAKGKITNEEAAGCFNDISFDQTKISRRTDVEGWEAKPKWKAPALGNNVTVEGLLDMLGDVRERKGDIDKEEKFLAEAFKVRLTAREAVVKEVVQEYETQEAADRTAGQNSETTGFSLWDTKDVD